MSNHEGGAGSTKHRTFLLEPLEQRELLSVCTWNRPGTDNKWSTAANWSGNSNHVSVGTAQPSLFFGNNPIHSNRF